MNDCGNVMWTERKELDWFVIWVYFITYFSENWVYFVTKTVYIWVYFVAFLTLVIWSSREQFRNVWIIGKVV